MFLRSARLSNGTVSNVRLDADRIAEVGEGLTAAAAETVVDLHGRLLLPSLVEPHAHLDKAFLAEVIPNPSGDLLGAISAMRAHRHLLGVEETTDRAERAARLMVSNGTTLIRTHADTTTDHGLRSVEALVAVRERLADLVDIQIVALSGWPITGAQGADARALLRDAIAAGADVVGGCPHLEDDPAAANETFLAIAADLGCDVDLHTDETLDTTMISLLDLAQRVTASGFPHRVTASHCVSLGMLERSTATQVAEAVAAAGIGVVTLPQTNLYLQGRQHDAAVPRGITAVHALRRAGVRVAAGGDNLQDPFNPLGRGDPLEAAGLMVAVAHDDPEMALASVTSDARSVLGAEPVSVQPGDVADLVVLEADSVRQAIALAPAARLVIRRGNVVERDAHAGNANATNG